MSDNASCDAMFMFDFHPKPAELEQIGHTSTGRSIEKRLGCALERRTERTQMFLLRLRTYRIRYTQFNNIGT